MKVKGVNLGNWLVLEKWMNPALFEGTTAEDEYWLPRQLSKEVYEARIKIHRSEYITERDFVTIKSWGLDAVRIPVPYFIFGDREPFIGCIEDLDKAFNWAEKYVPAKCRVIMDEADIAPEYIAYAANTAPIIKRIMAAGVGKEIYFRTPVKTGGTVYAGATLLEDITLTIPPYTNSFATAGRFGIGVALFEEITMQIKTKED